jgi:4,5-dihydroxyphthalate decarboxylase
MSEVALTLALSGYYHTDALRTGDIGVEGVDLTVLTLPVEEIFYRFTNFREWEVSEMSFAKYIALRSRGDESLVGIPVFPSRMFRHSSIYVPRDGATNPRELAGARIGVPEWAQTAAVYSRGLLQHDYGLALDEIAWFQAGVNDPGRTEKVVLDLPGGISLTRVPDRSLDQMLLAGELDAVLSAHPPRSIETGDPAVRRLFDDPVEVEREYAARTGIFPIMHLLAVRSDVHAAHPWVASNLLTAFERAKQRSLDALREMTASRVPMPWLQWLIDDAVAPGSDAWPYGVAGNDVTLRAFAQYAAEQGVASRVMEPEELFPAEVRSHFRV